MCIATKPKYSFSPAPGGRHSGEYMANTYTQIYIQVVFAVLGRQNLIHQERHRRYALVFGCE